MEKIVVRTESLSYGTRLKLAMASANLNASQLAHNVHVSKPTIYAYTSGRSIPDLKVASAIADATKQSLNFFKL